MKSETPFTPEPLNWAAEKRFANVLGRRMAYIERGQGIPIVFLHGNPTSSYLWRNILPHVQGIGRVIAPDLIGMGDSEKLPGEVPSRYRFECHARYLNGFMEAVGANRDVIFVLHDWGGALGFDWAMHHEGTVRGIAYGETFVCPLTLGDLPESFHPTLKAVRSEEGEALVLTNNTFIEKMLPGLTQTPLTESDMAEYRRPYLEPGESRLPTLQWPREVPLDGTPADVAERIGAYSAWLEKSRMPKLFLNADPGVFITGRVRDFCRNLPNQTEVSLPGLHFIPEDSPEKMGRAIAGWLQTLS